MEGFSHHSAQHNAEVIIQNLILIADHYAGFRCADCLTKHWNTVIAYASEGMTLDNALDIKGMLEKSVTLAEKHKAIIVECTVNDVCKVRSEKDMQSMIEEVREMRRDMSGELYGFDKENAHNITGHKHKHGRAHELELHN